MQYQPATPGSLDQPSSEWSAVSLFVNLVAHAPFMTMHFKVLTC